MLWVPNGGKFQKSTWYFSAFSVNTNLKLVNDKDKTESLNSFFINVGNNLADRFQNACNMNQHIYRITSSIQHLEFNCTRLLSEFKNRKRNKASALEDISARGLAIARSSAAVELSVVLKHCFATQNGSVKSQTHISSIHSK